MIDRILVPLDGSRMAEQILPHLRRLLYHHDSEVLLVRAAVPPPTEDGFLIADSMLGAAREYLLKIEDRLVAQGARVRSVVRRGFPVGAILDIAEEEKATMLALATHGETGLKRLLTGSVAEALLRKSPVPVLVVRPFWSYELLPVRGDEDDFRPIREILLPLDETEDAEILIPPVVELARLYDAAVVLLHVRPTESLAAGASDLESRTHEAHLAFYSKALNDQGVQTRSLMGKGEPASEILATARALDIDLITMTTHGKSGLLRFLSGSVPEKVLHESTCPILVVRAPVKRGKAEPSTRSANLR
jgi:nucleotide-binding universal stress UspA family protein